MYLWCWHLQLEISTLKTWNPWDTQFYFLDPKNEIEKLLSSTNSTTKLHQISKKILPKMPNINQNMSEMSRICAFLRIVQEIWWPIQETERFSLYLGDQIKELA